MGYPTKIVVATGPRIKIRHCRVCELPDEQRRVIEDQVNLGPQGNVAKAVRSIGSPFSTVSVTKHKQTCMGLGAYAAALPPSDVALVVIDENPVWASEGVRERARVKLLVATQKLEAQLAKTPTAAYYHTWLEFLQEIIKESEKGNGMLENQAKSYLETVQETRKVKRTMTIEETVVTTAEPPFVEVTVETPADAG
jgi:hypothetical protein